MDVEMDKSGTGHGRRRFWDHGLERSLGLEGARAASKADSPLNGDASGLKCPRGTRDSRSPSRFSPGGAWGHPAPSVPTPTAASELGNQLRPDRDHGDKKRDRRQRRSLFHECLQHGFLLILEHKKNIVPLLFQGVKGVKREVGQLEE